MLDIPIEKTVKKKKKKKKKRREGRRVAKKKKKTTKKATKKKKKVSKRSAKPKAEEEDDESFILDEEDESGEVQSIAEDALDDEEDAADFDRKDGLGDVRKQILKKYGKGTIILASENDSLDIARWSTGIMTLDQALGGGFDDNGRLVHGLPRGFFTSYYGGESDGKTTTALATAGAVQKCCRFCSSMITKKRGCLCGKNVPSTVAWWDAEGCFDRDWARRQGVDLRALHLIRTKTAEDGVDITRILLDSGDIDLLVVDSIACLTPKAEMVESMDKQMMGTSARLVNRAIRVWTGLLNNPDRPYNQQPGVILINQTRMKLGVMFGSPETRPGGRGQIYAEGVAVRFARGKYHFLNDDGKEIAMSNSDDEIAPAWRDIKFTTTKNKTGTAPRISGLYHLWTRDAHFLGHDYKRGDRSEIETLWGYGVKRGLIVKEGRTWTCGKLSATTRDGMKQKLSNSASERGRLKRAILAKLLE